MPEMFSVLHTQRYSRFSLFRSTFPCKDEMPLELESCFYQLAPGKIGFIIIHHFVKVARTIMTRLSEVLTVACCITERWCKCSYFPDFLDQETGCSEGWSFAQGHTAGNWQSPDSGPSSLGPESSVLTRQHECFKLCGRLTCAKDEGSICCVGGHSPGRMPG